MTTERTICCVTVCAAIVITVVGVLKKPAEISLTTARKLAIEAFLESDCKWKNDFRCTGESASDPEGEWWLFNFYNAGPKRPGDEFGVSVDKVSGEVIVLED